MKREPDIRGAQVAAAGLVEEYGIDRPELIDLDAIAFDRSVIVRNGEIDGAEAWLLRKGKRGIIRVSAGIPELGRRRFAVAHELGHWERHADASNGWFCTADDMRSYKVPHAELEANAFAAELLMPTVLMQDYVRDVSMEAVLRISGDFRTTLTASIVRLVDGSPQDAYLVRSRKRQVTWWHSKENGCGLWIEVGQRISPESKAYGCSTDPSDPEPMEEVSTEAWFSSDAKAGEYQVWEQSVLLKEYDTVLTLLHVV